jgi:hypothetical protein
MSKTFWRVLQLAQPMKNGMVLAVLLGTLTVGGVLHDFPKGWLRECDILGQRMVETYRL